MPETNVRYMQRAIELASLGLGNVSPNPMVGCVIVYQNQIIGEGFHAKYGEAHAEVNAINAVKDKSLLSESTVYVTLEPCTHFGKTPPCADLLIQHQVKKVIIACTDPNKKVNGKGIKKLEQAKIKVLTGVLEEQAKTLNRRFITNMRLKRPYIILKFAETANGFMARKNFDSKWISDAFSRKIVHKWRAEEDAILVGTNTILHDNPLLTVRNWEGRNPLRIFLDRTLKCTNKDLHLLDKTTPTICYNLKKSETHHHLEFVKLPSDNFLENLLSDLYQRNVGSLIIEGGSKTLHAFIQKNYWDEMRIFRSKTTFEDGIYAPRSLGKLIAEENLREDKLLVFRNN